MSQLDIFAQPLDQSGLAVMDDLEASGPGPDALAVQTVMQAEFPQYGWSTLRQLYKHWWYRDFHRQRCQTCLGGGPCELDAIYTKSLNHALQLISERTA